MSEDWNNYKEKGNTFFKNKDYRSAIDCYNKGIGESLNRTEQRG
jgi:hypothetical protein